MAMATRQEATAGVIPPTPRPARLPDHDIQMGVFDNPFSSVRASLKSNGGASLHSRFRTRRRHCKCLTGRGFQAGSPDRYQDEVETLFSFRALALDGEFSR
jgi:hypothetical protein